MVCVSKTKVLVAGASGYAGALAAQLVFHHPSLELARATGRSDVGTPLNELYVGTLENDGVGLAPYAEGEVDDELAATLDDLKAQIIAGDITTS